MNRSALLLALALCLPLAALADDASLHAKAQQLVAVLHTENLVQQVDTNLTREFSNAAGQTVGANPTPDQAAKLAAFQKNIAGAIDQQLGWQAIGQDFVDLYAKSFTAEQMDAIIAFYQTPAGIAFLDKTPALNAQMTQLLQSKISIAQPKLRKSLEDFRNDQAGVPPTPAPAGTPK
jgi:hypothetical protein